MSKFHSNITTRLQTRSQNTMLNLLRPQLTIAEELILKYDEHMDKQNEYEKEYPEVMNKHMESMKEDNIYVTEQQHIDRCNKIKKDWETITGFIEDLERCNCCIKSLTYEIKKYLDIEADNLRICNNWLKYINMDIDYLDNIVWSTAYRRKKAQK
jgi:hypothetical protein